MQPEDEPIAGAIGWPDWLEKKLAAAETSEQLEELRVRAEIKFYQAAVAFLLVCGEEL